MDKSRGVAKMILPIRPFLLVRWGGQVEKSGEKDPTQTHLFKYLGRVDKSRGVAKMTLLGRTFSVF